MFYIRVNLLFYHVLVIFQNPNHEIRICVISGLHPIMYETKCDVSLNKGPNGTLTCATCGLPVDTVFQIRQHSTVVGECKPVGLKPTVDESVIVASMKRAVAGERCVHGTKATLLNMILNPYKICIKEADKCPQLLLREACLAHWQGYGKQSPSTAITEIGNDLYCDGHKVTLQMLRHYFGLESECKGMSFRLAQKILELCTRHPPNAKKLRDIVASTKNTLSLLEHPSKKRQRPQEE